MSEPGIRDKVILEVLTVGPLQVNCYLLGCIATKEAIVIDPGDEAERILATLKRHDLKLRRIVNTHAHFDHLGGAKALQDATGAEFWLHRDDELLLNMLALQAAAFGMRADSKPRLDGYLVEGQTVTFGNLSLQVLHTPGHSPGSVSFHGGGDVFVGDVLFAGSIGRTDLPGGSYPTLIQAVEQKLFPLGDEVVVWPGHGPATTIGEERRYNPFFNGSPLPLW